VTLKTARLAAIPVSALLIGGAVAAAAPAARAGPPSNIGGVCNWMQAGAYQWRGIYLYKCVYIWGMGGYYWVYVGTAGGHCGPVAAAAPGDPASITTLHATGKAAVVPAAPVC
jgi:hypothetical protein